MMLGGGNVMPMLHMKEIPTPLKLFSIKLFKCSEGHIYIKIGKRHRKRILPRAGKEQSL